MADHGLTSTEQLLQYYEDRIQAYAHRSLLKNMVVWEELFLNDAISAGKRETRDRKLGKGRGEEEEESGRYTVQFYKEGSTSVEGLLRAKEEGFTTLSRY